MFGAYNYLLKWVDSFKTFLRGSVGQHWCFVNVLWLLRFKAISFPLVSKYISDKKQPLFFSVVTSQSQLF